MFSKNNNQTNIFNKQKNEMFERLSLEKYEMNKRIHMYKVRGQFIIQKPYIYFSF
jgi:hypothetical protein